MACFTPATLKRAYKVRKAKAVFNACNSALMPHKAKKHVIYELLKSKQQIIKPACFIETGTFLGEMVSAMQLFFNKIYSIELSEELALKAKNHFSKLAHVQIILGDSSTLLPELLVKIMEP